MTVPAMPEPLGWYVVNNIGMATLCKDEAEAQLLAEDCDMVYQRQAPHRAVQLVALAALQSAQPAGHSCIFHAVPLVPGDALGPQEAACTICGQPPRVPGVSQPSPEEPAAAGVSDEDVWQLWLRVCAESDNVSTRVMIANYARAILALRPQAVPMTDEQIKAARRSVCDDPNELPEPWAFRMGIRAAEAHHGITQRADGGEKQA